MSLSTEFNRYDKRFTVKTLVNASGLEKHLEIDFKVLAGEEFLDKCNVTYPLQIHKLSKLLLIDDHRLTKGAIVVISKSEVTKKVQSVDILSSLKQFKVACIVAVDGVMPDNVFIEGCNNNKIPLLLTSLSKDTVNAKLQEAFENLTEETITVHGSMVDVLGVGVLIKGNSGIGKSECCLDLITRGHRLVADDMVAFFKNERGGITGVSPDKERASFMEIRGLGIIEADRVFGISATRYEKDLDIVVKLVNFDEWKSLNLSRLSINDLMKFASEEELEYLKQDNEEDCCLFDYYFGVKVPMKIIPVAAGRNLANLIEVSARTYLLNLKH
jgi:HPr kinase/phosphorylase